MTWSSSHGHARIARIVLWQMKISFGLTAFLLLIPTLDLRMHPYPTLLYQQHFTICTIWTCFSYIPQMYFSIVFLKYISQTVFLKCISNCISLQGFAPSRFLGSLNIWANIFWLNKFSIWISMINRLSTILFLCQIFYVAFDLLEIRCKRNLFRA